MISFAPTHLIESCNNCNNPCVVDLLYVLMVANVQISRNGCLKASFYLIHPFEFAHESTIEIHSPIQLFFGITSALNIIIPRIIIIIFMYNSRPNICGTCVAVDLFAIYHTYKYISIVSAYCGVVQPPPPPTTHQLLLLWVLFILITLSSIANMNAVLCIYTIAISVAAGLSPQQRPRSFIGTCFPCLLFQQIIHSAVASVPDLPAYRARIV